MASILPHPLPISPPHLKPHRASPLLQQNLPFHAEEMNYISQATTSTSQENSPKSRVTIRTRLSQLCKDGRPDLACLLFNTLPRQTTVLWNTIIVGFICNGMPEEALHFYSRMKNSGTAKPDFYTYSSTLKACADTREVKLGKAIHCQIIRAKFNPNRILGNSLLNMYTTCLRSVFEEEVDMGATKFSHVDVVRKLFDTMRKRNAVTWNTMISWFVKTGRPLEALLQFKLMTETGIRPSAVSFINVFPAVVGIKDRSNSNVLYGLLLKSGPDFANDLFAVSSAIFMYSQLSDVDSARRVFECSVERNTEVWNTMIDGYVQNERPFEALELFLQIIGSEQIALDTVTFLAALMAASQIQQLEFGQQVHGYMIKYSMELPVILSNALLVMYSRCNSVETAFVLFHKMPERDLVSWNTMISAFVQNGFDVEGLMLTYEMQKQHLLIDAITATALLSAASNLSNLRIGKETHAYLFRHGIQFEGMDSYLIDMYAKSGLVETAGHLFENSHFCERDQVTWNAMIAGYMQNGQRDQAITNLQQMLKQNVIPNSVTLASVIPAFVQMAGTSAGKQLHGFAIRYSLDSNVYVGTALVDMYSKCGLINYAEKLFDGMPEKNSVSYTSMISGYGQHGLGEKAISLFWEMQEVGMKPDAVTFVAVLSACSYAGLIDKGLSIFESMEREQRISPTAEHFCCVVDMLGRAGRVQEAYEFAQKLGDASNVVGTWGSLLGACRIHREFELGKLVAEKLFEMGSGNSMSGYHVLLSNMYASQGKWDRVDQVRKMMREQGLKKEAGCSWIEVEGVVHRFMSKDQSHPHSEQLYKKLEELAMEIKAAGYRPTVGPIMDGTFEYEE